MTEDAFAACKRHRFAAEIIAHAVWLYHRFPLNLRDVEDLLPSEALASRFRPLQNGQRSLA